MSLPPYSDPPLLTALRNALTRPPLEAEVAENLRPYIEEPVFSFPVQKGEIVVQFVGSQPGRYAYREQALDRMADLLAQAAHDPRTCGRKN